MDIDGVLNFLDVSLYSKRRRHIIGGILISTSLLFGGLAVTVFTIKEDKENEEE